jgi:hypothetical protein
VRVDVFVGSRDPLVPGGRPGPLRDLEGTSVTADQDWVHIWTLPNHSYEARVS